LRSAGLEILHNALIADGRGSVEDVDLDTRIFCGEGLANLFRASVRMRD
jgi:hypothetical protein